MNQMSLDYVNGELQWQSQRKKFTKNHNDNYYSEIQIQIFLAF